MHNKILISSLILYGMLMSNAFAIDDISLSDRIRQEQRLKELNQQLEDKIPQLLSKKADQQILDFRTIIVKEEPCVQIKKIDFDEVTKTESEYYKFHYILRAIWNHPQQIIGKCIGTSSLRNLVNFAQNELIKKGFITSQITVDPQDLKSGYLRIGVKFGRLRKIIIQGESLTSLQRKAVLPFHEGDILNLKQLDQGLENLKRIYAVDIQIIPAMGAEQELSGYSDLIIQLQSQKKINLNVGVDNSGGEDTGKYIGSLGVNISNALYLNDIISINFSHSLDDLDQDLNKNYFFSYQIPFRNYDLSTNYSSYQYEQTILGANGPLRYHGKSDQTNVSLSRVISRSGQYKTSLYGKLYHKQNKNFIDDIEIEVQRRKTSGWIAGVQHRQYLGNAVLEGSLDYRHGIGAFDALLAPEEQIKDIHNNLLPAEGYSRAPILSADLRFQMPFLLLNIPSQYRLNWRGQYAPKLLVPNDRFYIGGRYSVRGFDGELMLSGDNGQYLQQEISLNTLLPNTQMYVGFDQGWVNGKHSIPGQRYLMGSVLGVRNYQNNFYLDFFTGRGLIAPDSIKKDWTFGFSFSVFY
ncbi:hemolysin activator protein [Acinetobacter baumannii]|uniref:ShlB/FhaC/HecB family hemolysin secretion/activation protein n=1 Tax=Acinetobacter baumannii TaxID=470 RepID=UPI00070791E8|nr:ShlB/FhaC/HecB family hemolysin secretion/activation protein [Acinetobacter baumannii]KQG95746.1 hemolysin activator protein [Acinetobacter baumannii]